MNLPFPTDSLLRLAATASTAPEDFMNGVLHPALAPVHWLTIGGAALWAGQAGAPAARRFLAGMLAGGSAAILLHHAGPAVPPDLARTGLLTLMALHGAATAARMRAPAVLPALSGALVAALVVSQTLAEEGGELVRPLVSGLGNLAGAVVTGILAAGAARSLATGKPWQAAAVRIAGSWILAIALLMLALPDR